MEPFLIIRDGLGRRVEVFAGTGKRNVPIGYRRVWNVDAYGVKTPYEEPVLRTVEF